MAAVVEMGGTGNGDRDPEEVPVTFAGAVLDVMGVEETCLRSLMLCGSGRNGREAVSWMTSPVQAEFRYEKLDESSTLIRAEHSALLRGCGVVMPLRRTVCCQEAEGNLMLQ